MHVFLDVVSCYMLGFRNSTVDAEHFGLLKIGDVFVGDVCFTNFILPLWPV